jgi:hypothetical protein
MFGKSKKMAIENQSLCPLSLGYFVSSQIYFFSSVTFFLFLFFWPKSGRVERKLVKFTYV